MGHQNPSQSEKLRPYIQTIEKVLKEYANVRYDRSIGQHELILDKVTNRFVLFAVGWENDSRIYHSIIHHQYHRR